MSPELLKKYEAGQRSFLEIDLRGVDLRWANLSGADLREADLDFSVWPLWCGSFEVKVDDRLVAQLIAHLTRLDVAVCGDRMKAAVAALMPYADAFCQYRDGVAKVSGADEENMRAVYSSAGQNFKEAENVNTTLPPLRI